MDRALGTDGQQLAVHVHIHRARIDAGKVGVQDVVVALAVQVNGHQPQPLPGVQQRAGHPVEFAERIKLHRHCHQLLLRRRPPGTGGVGMPVVGKGSIKVELEGSTMQITLALVIGEC